MDVKEIYKKYYKAMPVIPVALFVLLLPLIGRLTFGIDFAGGLSLTVLTERVLDTDVIISKLSELDLKEITVTRLSGGYIIEAVYGDNISDVEKIKEDVVNTVKTLAPDAEVVLYDVSPTLGKEFWNVMMNITIVAVLLLLLVIIFYFRHPLPTFIMVVSAVFDIAIMLSLMALTDIPLTLTTLAALLMIVGYSIDTDVIVSTFLFKRRNEADIYSLTERAFKTGVTMSLTTLIAMVVIYIVGFLTSNITVLRIANILVYGVMADILITWLFNAPVFIWLGDKHASSA